MDPTPLLCIAYLSLCMAIHFGVFAPLHYRHLILNSLKTGAKSFEEIQRILQLLPEEVREYLEAMERKSQLVRVSTNPDLFGITRNGQRDLQFYARFDRD